MVIRPFAAAFALAAAGVLTSAAVAAPGWTPASVHRHAGTVDAVLSFDKRSTGYGAFEYRKLRLVVRHAGKAVFDRELCTPERCGPGSQHGLKLQNVWGSSLPEAVIDLYAGGAHCCFENLIVLIDVAGRFADVTPTRLDLVRADAKQWWQGYVSQRGKADSDVRGVVAAWCADEYRLGLKQACTAELATALRRGYLRGASGWPANGAFVRALERSLAKWGYTAG